MCCSCSALQNTHALHAMPYIIEHCMQSMHAHKKSTVLQPTQVNRYILPRRKDNHLEGTRQIDSVTLGKGGPSSYILEGDTELGVATVY